MPAPLQNIDFIDLKKQYLRLKPEIDARMQAVLDHGQYITGGIGEALIATATGLCVAIFSLIVHTYFVQKLDEMLATLDKAAAAVRNALKKTGEDGHAA